MLYSSAARWPHLLPSIQLALNITPSRATGVAPYLIMFGGLPPPPPTGSPALPAPDATALSTFATAAQQHCALLQRTVRTHHAAYARAAQTDGPAAPALRLGQLVLIARPRPNKLSMRASGPYLVTALRQHTVVLANMATGAQLTEHRSNVTPLRLPTLST